MKMDSVPYKEIIIAAVVLVVFFILLLWWCCKRQRSSNLGERDVESSAACIRENTTAQNVTSVRVNRIQERTAAIDRSHANYRNNTPFPRFEDPRSTEQRSARPYYEGGINSTSRETSRPAAALKHKTYSNSSTPKYDQKSILKKETNHAQDSLNHIQERTPREPKINRLSSRYRDPTPNQRRENRTNKENKKVHPYKTRSKSIPCPPSRAPLTEQSIDSHNLTPQSEKKVLLKNGTKYVKDFVFKEKGVPTLDLHSMTQQEAQIVFYHFLYKHVERGTSSIKVIVGRGLHSENGQAKLKPLIKSLLDQRGYRYEVVSKGGAFLIFMLNYDLD